MPLIRDTIDPTREREVSDAEALALQRMGLLLTGTRARTVEGLTAAAVRQVQHRQDATSAAEAAVRPAEVPVEDDTPDGGHEHDQTSGADPASTTDDAPTTDASPQED